MKNCVTGWKFDLPLWTKLNLSGRNLSDHGQSVLNLEFLDFTVAQFGAVTHQAQPRRVYGNVYSVARCAIRQPDDYVRLNHFRQSGCPNSSCTRKPGPLPALYLHHGDVRR